MGHMRRDLIGETLLNQFRVENFIASGGMATIYRVWDLQRSVSLAMKVLRPELADDPDFIARFEREARSLQQLIHPNIVTFYGLYRADGLTFLLERYIDGPSLDEVLRQRGGRLLPLRDSLVYFKSLYTSLGYGHAQGIIHCDVKPANVLIDQGGHVYLTDFGIARYADAGVTTSSAMGTPLYMAPEQIRGERLSAKTDIYSLGVVMFELLTGQRPFNGNIGVPESVGENPSDRIRYQQLYIAPPNPHTVNPALPESLGAVVLKAMSKDPAARYPSVQAMADEIAHAVAARFETLPDRVRLDEELLQRPGWPGQDGVPSFGASSDGAPAYADPYNGVVIPPGEYSPSADWQPDRASAEGIPQTLPAAPPDGIRPIPIPRASAKPGLRGKWGWLAAAVSVLVLLSLCGLLGSRLMQGLGTNRRPNLPVSQPSSGTQTPGGSITPTQGSSPTAQGLTNFPVPGEITVLQRDGAITTPYLLNAGSGALTALPAVPNVRQINATAPQWSPDGSRMVFVAEYNGRTHVAVVEMSSLEPYQLPAAEAYSRVSSPAWLPDGKRVSFWASGGNQNWFVIADATTGELIERTALNTYRNLFVWNVKSSELAFVQQDNGVYRVFLSGSPSGTDKRIENEGEGYAPAWSNDGQWIAFQGGPAESEIWIARADGSDPHQVTTSPEGSWSRAPSWSPDGKMIAFVSNRSGSVANDYGELFVLDIASGHERQMTDTGGRIYDWRPAWRP